MVIYFSGTGNSYAVAQAVAKKHEDTVVAMKRAQNDGSSHLIFVFPTYACDIPLEVKAFIEAFVIEPHQQVMGISVSGGDNGMSEYSFRTLIEEKGMQVSRFQNVIMTENSGAIMFGMRTRKIEVDMEKIATTFWTHDSAPTYRKPNMYYKAMYKGLFSKTGKKLLRKKVDKEACIGCGTCEKICPVDNITIQKGKACIGEACAECFGCMHWCPKQAIRIGKTVRKEDQYRHADAKLGVFNQ